MCERRARWARWSALRFNEIGKLVLIFNQPGWKMFGCHRHYLHPSRTVPDINIVLNAAPYMIRIVKFGTVTFGMRNRRHFFTDALIAHYSGKMPFSILNGFCPEI